MQLWRNLRTVWNLAGRLEDLERQWDDVRVDLADKLDKLDRLMRRMTLRAQRSGDSPEIVVPAVTQGDSNRKNELRAIAREKGLIR